MISLTIIVILWMPYVMKLSLPHAQQTQKPTRDGSPQVRAEPPRPVLCGTHSQDEQFWSALDDRRLTRLLTDSAPRTTPEQDLL